MQDIGLCKMNGQQAGTLHGDVVKLYQSDLVIHDTGAGPGPGRWAAGTRTGPAPTTIKLGSI